MITRLNRLSALALTAGFKVSVQVKMPFMGVGR